jgi:hypothetical protein
VHPNGRLLTVFAFGLMVTPREALAALPAAVAPGLSVVTPVTSRASER